MAWWLMLACATAGSPSADSPPPPGDGVEVTVTDPVEAAARAWGATRFGVPAADLAVGRLSNRAGDPILSVRPPVSRKAEVPAAVLVRGDQVFAGREGFERWAADVGREDPAPLAVACAFLVLGTRDEPFGDWTRSNPEGFPAPAWDAQGRLVFWFREPTRSVEQRAIVTLGPDGEIVDLARED